MSHFFVNLDKLLYSFKKKNPTGCLNFVGSKKYLEHLNTLGHMSTSASFFSLLRRLQGEEPKFKDGLGKYFDRNEYVSRYVIVHLRR